MRSNDRYGNRRDMGGIGSSPSMDDLNDALSSLERRIGIADRPARARSDLDEIRERQSQIGARLAPRQPAGRAHDLKQELADLRRELAREQSMASRAAPAPMRGGDDNSPMSELRSDIEQLKQDVTFLAREDSIRELTDRWTVLEREFARLPETLGSREDLLGVVERIDTVSETLSALPQAIPVAGMETQLHSLANAMERMAAAHQPVSADGIDAVHGRLDEISRAIAAIPANQVSGGVDPAMLERLEARIAGLAQALEARDEPEMDRIDDHFAALARRLDDVQQAAAVATRSEPLDDINMRLEGLHGTIQQMAQSSGVPTSPEDIGLLNTMAKRLEGVAARVEAQEQLASETVGSITSALDNRMQQLAAYLDKNRAASGEGPDLRSLESRLDEIGSMLSNTPAAGQADLPPQADFTNLEAQIAHLSQELSTLTPGASADFGGSQLAERLNAIEGHLQRGEDDIMATARAAAEQAVSRLDPASGDGDHEAIRELAERLGELDVLSRETSSRNSQTFEAIHDTLLKVVDHLSGLEERVTTPATASAPESTHETPQPIASVDAPPLSMGDDEPVPFGNATETNTGAAYPSGHRAQAMPPAHAAAAAALAALNNDEAIAGALGPDTPTSNLDHAPHLEPEGDLDDVMIAPGADSPDLASIIQRVRNESSDNRSQRASSPGVESAKSDFIAAARRAAQAAVADVSVTEPDEAGAKGAGKLGALKQSFSARRKPILMGAGAILLALLAIPAVSSLFGGGQEDYAAFDDPAPIVEQQMIGEGPITDEEFAAVEDTNADAAQSDDIVPDDNGFRIVDETPVAQSETEIIEDTAPAPVFAEQEPATADLVMEVAAGPAVPEGIGSIQLQEAAQAGDPKAMFVVGEAVAARGGNTPESLTNAAQWYQRSAELGFAPAQYRYGNFLEKGTAGTQDVEQAKVYYQLAAQQGNASAMHNLGSLTAGGQAGGADMATAAQWFHQAAELGVRDSQFNLGILYGLGNGVEVDLVESYKWFALAANDGDAMAAERRDEIAAQLDAEDLEMAEGAVKLWQAKPVIAEANSVDVPDGWKVAGERVASTEPAADPEVMEKAVRNIQAILNETGYDAGPVDGLMGNKTRNAIISFQQDNGMTADGNINQALVEKLLEVYEAASES